MARQVDRSEPAIERAGCVFIASTALLLFVSASQAWAEDEPAARAPLPPPRSAAAAAWQGAAAEPGAESQINRIRGRRQSSSIDQSPNYRKGSLASTPHRIVAKVRPKKPATLRLANRSIDADSRRQHHRAVIFEKIPRRDRSATEAAIGHLSPPSDYPDPRLRSTTEALPEPPQAPPYYPNYFVGLPGYGYAPSYPYAWVPPGLGVFR